MKLLGSVLGGQGEEERGLVKDLLRDLVGVGVSHTLWERVVTNSKVAATINVELTHDSMAVLSVQHPEKVCELARHCADTLEGVLLLDSVKADAAGGPGQAGSLDERARTALTIAATILMRILAALRPDVQVPTVSPGVTSSRTLGNGATSPAGRDGAANGSAAPAQQERSPTSSAGQEGGHPLLRKLWAPNSGIYTVTSAGLHSGAGRPLAERILECCIRLLFLRGFSIDAGSLAWAGSPDPSDEPASASEARDLSELVSAVAKSVEDQHLRSGRHLALQLLLVTLCAGAPATAVARDQACPAAASWQLDAAQAVADSRLHEYLRVAGSSPWVQELVASLLASGLAGGGGGGLFGGGGVHAVQWLSLQALCALLQDPEDASAADCIAEWCPQARWDEGGTQAPELSCGMPGSSMRSILDGVLGTEGCVKLIAEGMARDLPAKGRGPPFRFEYVTLLFHLSGCPSFVRGLCAEGCVGQFVAGVLSLHPAEAGDEGATGVAARRKDLLALLTCSIFLRLTATPEVYEHLYAADSTLSVPFAFASAGGRLLDVLWMAAVRDANDFLAGSLTSQLHATVVRINLAVVCNLSPFAIGLLPDSSRRLFALFERCLKPVVAKGQLHCSVGGLIPYFLECYLNAVQYQYTSNLDLVYGLATRHSLFREVLAIATDAEAQEEQELLRPMCRLLDALVPPLEAQVMKSDILNAEEAKTLLPRVAVGLLPVPRAYVVRTLRYASVTHVELECHLIRSVAGGPLAQLYETQRR